MDFISSENLLLAGSLLLIAGVLIGKGSYRTGLPLLLIFLLVGMAFGTDGLGWHFENMHTAQNVGMVALCIILFSGGMSTSIKSIRPVLSAGLVLSTLGVLCTALLTGLFIYFLSGQTWTNIHFALLPSLLLAATMSSTDSASVFGILGTHKMSLKQNLRPMLELESGSNDPMAYMLSILLLEAITLGGSISPVRLCVELAMQFGIGVVGGLALGYGAKRLVGFYRKLGNRREDAGQAVAMSSVLLIASLFLTYALTAEFGGNGYLAVYICGIVVGNSEMPHHKSISRFMDGMTWIAQIVVFLMLGLLVNPHEMMSVALVSALIGVFIILVGRPLSVMLCLLPFRRLTFKAKCFVSWVGLRGAVPIIFATYPVVAGIQGASQIFNIVFFVTLLSLLIQGTTVTAAARKLDLVEPPAPDNDDFGVELDEELPTTLQTMVLAEEHLAGGNTLSDINLPAGMLVIMIKRNGGYIVPDGKKILLPGDALLIITSDERGG